MLATYLHALATIRATGAATAETSYYGPLENLLNAAGATLKPPVRAVFQLADLDVGRPDFGLFAAGQFERPADGTLPERRADALPERGAGEVKGGAESLDRLLASRQVSKYRDRYRQVLVTNLHQFAFVAEGADGQPLLLDSFALADTEAGFWTLCHDPTPPPAALAAGFGTFLERCLRHAAPLDEPRDLAADYLT